MIDRAVMFSLVIIGCCFGCLGGVVAGGIHAVIINNPKADISPFVLGGVILGPIVLTVVSYIVDRIKEDPGDRRIRYERRTVRFDLK